MIPFEFNADTHVYSIAGRPDLPGCTRVIDRAGMVDYSRVRPDILERKSRLGKEVHRVTKLWDAKRLDIKTVDYRVLPFLESWIYFRQKTGFVPTLSEYQCIAEVNGMLYGMQIDALGLTGRFVGLRIATVVEKKCTVTIMPHHAVQTAGYALGLPLKIKGREIRSALARFASRRRIIVQLRPSGIPNIQECDHKEDADAFLHALWLTEWKRLNSVAYGLAA